VLHTGYDLPVLSVPSVYMSAVGTRPVAVPNFALTRRCSIERCEAALTQTRLTLHKTRLRPVANGTPTAWQVTWVVPDGPAW
jgi:hypothetical protein